PRRGGAVVVGLGGRGGLHQDRRLRGGSLGVRALLFDSAQRLAQRSVAPVAALPPPSAGRARAAPPPPARLGTARGRARAGVAVLAGGDEEAAGALEVAELVQPDALGERHLRRLHLVAAAPADLHGVGEELLGVLEVALLQAAQRAAELEAADPEQRGALV